MINIEDGTRRTRTVPLLAKNEEYEFQLLAYTSVGDGPKSSVKVLPNEDGNDGSYTNSFANIITVILIQDRYTPG